MASPAKFTAVVTQDIIDRIHRDAKANQNKASTILQEQIEDFDIPDSGLLAFLSFVKVTTSNSDVVATFLFTTRGVKYAKYVNDGSGSNKSIGERRYLEFGAKNTLQYLKQGSYSRSYRKGGQNKGARIYSKKA